MEKLEYPLVGYAAQFAEQDAIFERYGKHMHICVVDPDKYRIETPEKMEQLIADFEPWIKFEEQEERYSSGEDPEPNLTHIEIDNPEAHYATAIISELEKTLIKEYSLGYSVQPSDDEKSAGKLVVHHGMDLEHQQRICFEFSNTGVLTSKLTMDESTEMAIKKIKTWLGA